MAQLPKKPLLDHDSDKIELVIGKKAKKLLTLNIPLFISDMSFCALSIKSIISLVKDPEIAETRIYSREGGMLPEEQESNSKYFYKMASQSLAMMKNS